MTTANKRKTTATAKEKQKNAHDDDDEDGVDQSDLATRAKRMNIHQVILFIEQLQASKILKVTFQIID